MSNPVPYRYGRRILGVKQYVQCPVTVAANYGDLVLATSYKTSCCIRGVIIRAVAASQTDLTTCAVYAGAAKVITLVTTAQATKADLTAIDQQVCRALLTEIELQPSSTIIMTLAGTGITPVNLLVSIEYEAMADGGYIA